MLCHPQVSLAGALCPTSNRHGSAKTHKSKIFERLQESALKLKKPDFMAQRCQMPRLHSSASWEGPLQYRTSPPTSNTRLPLQWASKDWCSSPFHGESWFSRQTPFGYMISELQNSIKIESPRGCISHSSEKYQIFTLVF